jgi:hypothetical protein
MGRTMMRWLSEKTPWTLVIIGPIVPIAFAIYFFYTDEKERSHESLPEAVLVAHVKDCRVYRTVDDHGQTLYISTGDFGVACGVTK